MKDETFIFGCREEELERRLRLSSDEEKANGTWESEDQARERIDIACDVYVDVRAVDSRSNI
jgi:hypothetical protein